MSSQELGSLGIRLKDNSSQTTANKSRTNQNLLVWDKKVPNTELEKFRKIIEEKYNKKFDSYWDLHSWSVEYFDNFWEEVWQYYNIIASKPYKRVFTKVGDGFLDNEWFTGAAFNIAENILRIRDDKVAIVHEDENGFEEHVTFLEMFEEVELYAAAFRKFGLKKEDTVACYISNRKEAVFIFLAVTSIGAIFGGPQPYFGAKAASNIVKKMDAKILISIDYHQDYGIEFANINNLSEIANNCPTLQKVIVIPTKSSTLTRNLSDIRNCCLLKDFLNSGRNPDGTVPDIVFEQLPFNHPIKISFTSGTTGLPKGPVHSAGTIISHLISTILPWNLKSGDCLYSFVPTGWTLFDLFLPCLACGVKLFLFAGSAHYIAKGKTVWDLLAKHKVTYAFFVPSVVDKLEKLNIIPDPNLDLSSLKIIAIGGSPVKPQNCLFFKNAIKEDVFICSQYGTTESFGLYSGYDLNLPSYAGEIQTPGLGMDIQCYDHEGNSVVNVRGEMVIATPTPGLLSRIWKDEDNKILNETYLSKFPGVWCQSDEILINLTTNGIVVIGRSDDTLKQNGERFGAGDIYFAIHDMEEIDDYLCVSQNKAGGDSRAVLFVKMREGYEFTPEFKNKIEDKILQELWCECIPEVILETKGVPYNLNNKKSESLVRKIVATNKVPEVNNIRNPESLQYYCNIPELMNYN